MSLAKQTFTGLSWSFAQQFSGQLVSFISSVVLARVLLPEEFGLIGMLAIFMAIGNVLISGGLTTSLLRTAHADQIDYSTVFFINLCGSCVIYLLMFGAAPSIAAFFKQPQLVPITRVYTLGFIIGAFSSVQLVRIHKQLDFKTEFKIQLPSLITSSILGVSLAYNGVGVWSLVWMYLCQNILFSAQLWYRTRWRPSLVFNTIRFRKHFNFGYKLMISGLLDALFNNVYHIIIGRLMPAAHLGYYTRAMGLRQLPAQNLSTALNKVTFPMFARIQYDDEKLRMAYKKIMQQVIFWVAPSLVVLGVLAEPLFIILFTDKWLPAVPYFQILCIPGILYPLHSYNLNILNVKGRSDIFFKLEIVKKLFVTIGVIMAFPFGIYGLLYFQVISSVFSYVVNSWYSGKLIKYGIKHQVLDILPIILLSLGIGALTWFIDTYILIPMGSNNIFRLSTGLIVFFGSYTGLSILLKFQSIHDFKTLVLKR